MKRSKEIVNNLNALYIEKQNIEIKISNFQNELTDIVSIEYAHLKNKVVKLTHNRGWNKAVIIKIYSRYNYTTQKMGINVDVQDYLSYIQASNRKQVISLSLNDIQLLPIQDIKLNINEKISMRGNRL